MKRVATILSLLFLSLCVMQTAQAQTHEGAHLSLVNSTCDFGEISRRGKDLVREIEYVNNGTSPLVVLSVTTSCSCLKADFSRKPVAPNGRGVIRIICEVRKMDAGVFHRVIRVNSNSADGVRLITVQGNATDNSEKAEKTEKVGKSDKSGKIDRFDEKRKH